MVAEGDLDRVGWGSEGQLRGVGRDRRTVCRRRGARQETIIAGSADKAPGAAYVFTQSGATWPQVAKLTAPGTDPGDNFGSAVAQRGGTAVIGARSKQDEGTAYLFTKAGTWKLVTELQVPARAEHDEVGSSVALGILPAGVLATVGSLQGGKGAVHVFLAPH
jgi:hypothetical protein